MYRYTQTYVVTTEACQVHRLHGSLEQVHPKKVAVCIRKEKSADVNVNVNVNNLLASRANLSKAMHVCLRAPWIWNSAFKHPVCICAPDAVHSTPETSASAHVCRPAPANNGIGTHVCFMFLRVS